MRESTVSASIVIDMVGYLVGCGVPLADICRAAEFEMVALESPDERLPGSLVERLWAVGERLTGDADLGLHAAEAHRPEALSIVGYVVLNCRTVADALERLGRYFAVLNDGLRVTTDPNGELALCWFEAIAGLDNYLLRHPRHAMEATATAITRSLATLAWEPIAPLEVAFRHGAPASVAEHARIFGAPVRFAQPRDQLVFRSADLQRRLRSANPVLLGVLERHADEMLAQVGEHGPVSRKLLRALAPRLQGSVPALAELARALAMSVRSLQRALRDEGASYQALVDQARRELALRHLAALEGSAAEVAFLLGFSDASAFTRAFRRWTGSTPGAWRAANGSGRSR